MLKRLIITHRHKDIHIAKGGIFLGGGVAADNGERERMRVAMQILGG